MFKQSEHGMCWTSWISPLILYAIRSHKAYWIKGYIWGFSEIETNHDSNNHKKWQILTQSKCCKLIRNCIVMALKHGNCLGNSWLAQKQNARMEFIKCASATSQISVGEEVITQYIIHINSQTSGNRWNEWKSLGQNMKHTKCANEYKSK